MTEILANPLRSRDIDALSRRSEALAFHRRLPGYRPTPLVPAPDLADGLGLGRLWVKVESSRLGLPSFKVLGASWATYRLLLAELAAIGVEKPAWSDIHELRAGVAPLGALTLAAATDGNHGRAVAHMARLLGLSARIFVPDDMVPARISAIESEGADVIVVRGSYDDAVRASAAEPGVLVVSDTSWEGYVDVPAWVIEGYGTIFAEVDAQLDGAIPDVVVVQMGVGALCAATVAAYAGSSRVVAVEPESAACGLRSAAAGTPVTVPGPHPSIMSGLNCGNVSLVAWPAVAAGVDVFLAIDDGDIAPAMRDLAGIGVEAGETGAAGLAGLRALVDAGPDSGVDLRGRSVLLLCTEGATDPVAYERIVGSVIGP
jgi:diaminopropionate ammonia-lyase